MDRYTQLYVHCVWATWERLPLILPEVEAALYASLADKCHQLDCALLAVGGVADHVHCLIQFTPTIALSRLVGEMKGTSSHLVNRLSPSVLFKWQGGYGAFTVSKRSLLDAQAYIANQKQHHRDGSSIKLFELE